MGLGLGLMGAKHSLFSVLALSRSATTRRSETHLVDALLETHPDLSSL